MNTVHRLCIPPTVLPDDHRSKQQLLAGSRPQIFVCNCRQNPLSRATGLVRTAFRAILILTAMFCATSAKAKLGETVSQLTKRFGRPYENNALDGGRMAYSFHEHGYDVEVVVENDRSAQETYYSFEPLQPNGDPPNVIVRGILQTNVPGAKWRDTETEGRKEEAAFVTADGKYRAGIFLGVYHPGPTVGATFVVLIEKNDHVAPPVHQERSADATPAVNTAQSTPGQQASTVPTPEADKERGAITADTGIRKPSVDSVPVNTPPNNTGVQHAPDTENVYADSDSEAFRKLTPEEQACDLAVRKLGESFVRKLAHDDPDGKTDSFVTKVVERTWGPRGRPRDWKDSNPPRRWITQYKNVTSKVQPDQLTEVDRMNGWRWRGWVVFSAKYMRQFSGMNATYFGESTSGQLRPGEWKASVTSFLEVSLANRDGKWTVSVSHIESNLEYGKPSEAEMREYDAAAEGTGSR